MPLSVINGVRLLFYKIPLSLLYSLKSNFFSSIWQSTMKLLFSTDSSKLTIGWGNFDSSPFAYFSFITELFLLLESIFSLKWLYNFKPTESELNLELSLKVIFLGVINDDCLDMTLEFCRLLICSIFEAIFLILLSFISIFCVSPWTMLHTFSDLLDLLLLSSYSIDI